MDNAETLYGYFDKALKHSVDQKGRGAQKTIAIDAGISPPSLSQILSDTSRKRASLKTQVELAKACGYQYEAFLAMGRKLVAGEEPDSQERSNSTNLTKEVPEKEVKVGKKMEVQELKELLQYYKGELSELREEIRYLRERNRELETAMRETEIKDKPPMPEKKTAS